MVDFHCFGRFKFQYCMKKIFKSSLFSMLKSRKFVLGGTILSKVVCIGLQSEGFMSIAVVIRSILFVCVWQTSSMRSSRLICSCHHMLIFKNWGAFVKSSRRRLSPLCVVIRIFEERARLAKNYFLIRTVLNSLPKHTTRFNRLVLKTQFSQC